jgi:hypothetical protein
MTESCMLCLASARGLGINFFYVPFNFSLARLQWWQVGVAMYLNMEGQTVAPKHLPIYRFVQ